MNEEQYETIATELRDTLNEKIVLHLEEGVPQSEVDAAQAAYDYHVANRDILITE
jgi:hypothetical protein